MDVLKPTLGGGGGMLRQEFLLHETDRMKIVGVYWIAPGSDHKHINLRIEYISMEKSLKWLSAKVEENVDETVFQKWFEENTWIFGKNYVQRVPKRTIGLESRADLIYISVDGFADLVELKKSVLAKPILLPDPSHKTFYLSAELSRALAQAMHYLQVIEDHRLQLVALVNIPVLRPTITIVIGRSNDWDEPIRNQLRILNSTLLNIKILTYDHLLTMGNNILKLYAPDEEEIPF